MILRHSAVLLAGLSLFAAQSASGQELSDAAKGAAKQSNAFAYDLYNELKEGDGNLFFSPYSISSALTMTWVGARGQTASEMARVLHQADQTPEQTHKALGELLKHLNGAPTPTAPQPASSTTQSETPAAPGDARGARGAIQGEEAGRAVKFPARVQEYLDRIRSRLSAALAKAKEAAKQKQAEQRLSVANGIWPDRAAPLLPEYVETLRSRYGAGVQAVDYQGNPAASRETINTWVAQQTNDKIKDLLPDDAVTTDTRLILTNAIYFKGSWDHEFKKDQTRPLPFTKADGATVQVPVMTTTHTFGYAEADGTKILDLPYKGKQRSMTILLPATAAGLPAVEQALVSGKLDAQLGQLGQVEVNVQLPRFKLELEKKLKGTLNDMPKAAATRGEQARGMPSAFGPLADFSGINGKKNLRITEVVHKAFVDVNEEGTEAAAATGVVVGIESVQIVKQFHATRPFVFIIRDKASGAILFIGRVSNPAE